MRGAQLEDHLLLRAQVELLEVAPLAQVPDVKGVAVLAGQQQLGIEPVLDHVRGAPLARDQGVVAEVPGEVVGEDLRAPVDFPSPEGLEVVVVEDEDAAWAIAFLRAQSADVDSVGRAVDGVKAGVARTLGDVLGFDDFDDARVAGIGLGVDDVHPRGAESRDQEVAALDVRVRRVGAEGGAAGVPAEVVELVAGVGHLHAADDLGVRGGAGVDVDDAESVGAALEGGVEGGEEGEPLRWRLHCEAGGGIEGRIRCEERHGSPFHDRRAGRCKEGL